MILSRLHNKKEIFLSSMKKVSGYTAGVWAIQKKNSRWTLNGWLFFLDWCDHLFKLTENKNEHDLDTLLLIRAHVAKFYGRLRLIRSVWRASTFPCLKLIEIVIL